MDEKTLWWRDGVIYQIYPRSFADSSGDGIGDLNGIIGRLDYLQDLGVDAVWLSPINPSPMVDFGYDVSDYNAIDPLFGTLDDFKRLLEQAHRRGIRVILDLVLNHSSDQHPWFVQSRSSKENPYRDWYVWRPGKPGGAPPNNWQSIFGGGGWEFDPHTGEYYFHMFCKEQPDFNWRNPATRQALLDVFRYWCDLGVDGFRLDVFPAYFMDEDLRDQPYRIGIRPFDMLQHIHDVNQPEMIPLLQDIRRILDGYPESYAVGEPFLGSLEQDARYSGADRLHGVFDFRLINSRWSAGRFARVIQTWDQAQAPDAWPVHVLNNHDNRRSASRFGRGEDDERLKMTAALLLTLRGTPFLYYGEEIGMRNIKVPRRLLQDPVGKRYWPLPVGRDGCRSPMQWDGSANAGFSRAQPWLPVHPDFTARNTAAQREDPTSLFNFHRRLIALRKAIPALRSGMYLPLTSDPRFILAYLRQTEEQSVLVAMNFHRRKKLRFFLGLQLAGSQWELLLSNKREKLDASSFRELKLQPEEVCILLKK